LEIIEKSSKIVKVDEKYGFPEIPGNPEKWSNSGAPL
jgi:hypothetical protein